MLQERTWAGVTRTLHLLLWGLLAEVLSQVLLPHTRGLFSSLSWTFPSGEAVAPSAPSGAELLAVNFLGAALSGFVTAFEMLPGAGAAALETCAVAADSDDSGGVASPRDSMEEMSLMAHDASGDWPDGEAERQDIPELPHKYGWKDAPAGGSRRTPTGPAAQAPGLRSGRPGAAAAPRRDRSPSSGGVGDPCLRTAHAFKNGFVPVCTSYLAVVERVGSLIARERWRAALGDFAAAFLGGPAVFTVALMAGRWWLRRLRCASRDSCRARGSPEARVLCVKAAVLLAASAASAWALLAESYAMMPYPEVVGVTWRMPAVAPGADRRHQDDVSAPYLWWQLPWGACGVVVALLAGDLVGRCAEGRRPLPRLLPGVNWRAAAQNAAALVIGHLLLILEALLVESPAKLARLQKAHQAAGGTLSAYSGFVETVGVAAWKGDWRRALANLAVNAYLAGLSVLLVLQIGAY